MTQRAIQAIESIAAFALDQAAPANPGFPTVTYVVTDQDKVEVCHCTQAIQIQFRNLWAYYAPGRKVSYQEGDEEMLVEVSRALEDGSFFAL